MSQSHTLALSTFHAGVLVSKSAVYMVEYLVKSNGVFLIEVAINNFLYLCFNLVYTVIYC